MASHSITPEAHRENVRVLAQAAGISELEASGRLDGFILVTHDHADSAATSLVAELLPLLERTMPCGIDPSDNGTCSAEVIVGSAKGRSSTPQIYVSLQERHCRIGLAPEGLASVAAHPLCTLIAACYAAGAALHQALGDGIPNPPIYPYTIDYAVICGDVAALDGKVEIGEAYLAGAGAIGNGFLWAARHVSLQGTLHVVDDDHVSSGNLQRQIWFDEDDLEKPKAEVLAAKAQPFLPDCRLVPQQSRLQQHPNRAGRWLRRLIVGVDSRRARRELQNELPGEVFDASTTGIEEIVIHYNRQPTELACMGCLYFRDDREVTQDESLAAHLGVSITDVRTERVSLEAARSIVRKHGHLDAEAIIGAAYDTLYKELCSSGKLANSTGENMIAPFAFVSVLAGALLLVEVIRRVSSNTNIEFNEWRVAPWRPPFGGARRLRVRRADCECCGREPLRRLSQKMWAD